MTDADHEKVRAAVAKAESTLSAEIVPCVFAQSSPYPELMWQGACAGMSLAIGALFVIDTFHPLWTDWSRLTLWITSAGMCGAAFGRWCGPIKRILIGHQRMEDSVSRRAKEVFFDRGIARTTGRVGVLIFASLLERRVVVLADEAVRVKVPAGAWDATVSAMTALAAEGRVADGLCAAVEAAAKALVTAGFSGKPARNELGDAPLLGNE